MSLQVSCNVNDQFSGSSGVNWGQESGIWAESGGFWQTTGTAGTDTWTVSMYGASTGCNDDIDVTAKMWRDGDDASSNNITIRASGAFADGEYENQYSFQYNRSGFFSVWKIVAGSYSAVQSWAVSSAIAQGAAYNKLRVVMNGSSMKFYINDVLVWTGTDTELTSGKFGVSMYDTDEKTGDKLWVDYVTASTSTTVSTSQTVSAAQKAANIAANLSPKGSVYSPE